MKQKILQALKTKFSNKGFGAKALESVADYLVITVKEESEIDNAISGVEPLLAGFQSEIDRRVNETRQQQQQQNQPAGSDDGKGNPQENPPADPPAWAKAFIGLAQQLQGDIAEIKGSQVQKTRSQTLTEKLKDASEAFRNKILKDFSRMQFQSEEDFNTYLEDTEKDVKEAVQSAADAGLSLFPQPTPPVQGSNNNDKTVIEQWAKEKVDQSKQS